MINLKELKLSSQRALLGEITANMRAITIESKDDSLLLRVIFYENPSEDEKDSLGDITAEILADFNEINHVNEEFIIDSDSPFKSLECLDFWAYARK